MQNTLISAWLSQRRLALIAGIAVLPRQSVRADGDNGLLDSQIKAYEDDMQGTGPPD